MDAQHPTTYTLDPYWVATVRRGISTRSVSSFNRDWRGQSLVYILISLFIHLVHPAGGISVNVTVDDTFGNADGSVLPTYLPDDADTWHVGSPTEQCETCAIRPSELDMGQIVGQSWHHATYFVDVPIEVKISFPGTAVYVYNIIPNYLPGGAATLVNISFALDGEMVGHFLHSPDSSSDFLYNQLVYANASLSGGSHHTLVMSASGRSPSVIVFDYLLYTTDAEEAGATSATAAAATSNVSSSPSPVTTLSASSPAASSSASSSAATSSVPPPTATIVGGVIGGVALLLVGAALLFVVPYRLRRRRRRRHQTLPLTEPESGSTSAHATATTPSLAAFESSRSSPPISIGLLSNAATVAVPSLGSATIASPSSSSSRPFEPKREAELRRRNDSEELQERGIRMDTTPPSVAPLRSGQERRSASDEFESDMSEGLGLPLGAVQLQELQGEIAALRNVLSAVTARGGLALHRPAISSESDSDVLPAYEEARCRDMPRNAGSR